MRRSSALFAAVNAQMLKLVLSVPGSMKEETLDLLGACSIHVLGTLGDGQCRDDVAASFVNLKVDTGRLVLVDHELLVGVLSESRR